MMTYAQEIIKPGDYSQLKYLRDRYHYLISQKFDIEDIINQANEKQRPLKLMMTQYLKIKSELILIDETRTKLVYE